jgi:hypothetical protein
MPELALCAVTKIPFTASEADMASYGPSKTAKLEPPAPSIAWQALKIITHVILLGVPRTYARRLQKADWVQVSIRLSWLGDILALTSSGSP